MSYAPRHAPLAATLGLGGWGIIIQASAPSSPFLKTPTPFLASAANRNHLPRSHHRELALSNSSSLSHAPPSGLAPAPHFTRKQVEAHVLRREINQLGGSVEWRWGTGVELTATVCQWATTGRRGSPAARANSPRGHRRLDAGLGSRDHGQGALRSSHKSKQGR